MPQGILDYNPIDPQEQWRRLQMQPGGQPLQRQQEMGQYLYGPQFNAIQGASIGDRTKRFGTNLGAGMAAGLLNMAVPIPGLNLGSALFGKLIKTQEKYDKKKKKDQSTDSASYIRSLLDTETPVTRDPRW